MINLFFIPNWISFIAQNKFFATKLVHRKKTIYSSLRKKKIVLLAVLEQAQMKNFILLLPQNIQLQKNIILLMMKKFLSQNYL